MLTTACIDEALTSLELSAQIAQLRPARRTQQEGASERAGPLLAPSLASTQRPRLSTDTMVGQARAASQRPLRPPRLKN